MSAIVRQAVREDIPAMHRLRLAVLENRRASPDVTEAAYLPAIEGTGRGWVIDVDGEVVAFAIGNKQTGNIWALFVDPKCEGCGHGRRLLEVMMSWLFSVGVARAWLSTEPNTRAQNFYEAAGWTYKGKLSNGEASYELRNPGAP